MRFLLRQYVIEKRMIREREVEANDATRAAEVACKEWNWPATKWQNFDVVALPHAVGCTCGEAYGKRSPQSDFKCLYCTRG